MLGISSALFLGTIVAVGVVAAVFGGRDERLAALALVSATILTPLMIREGFAGPELGVVIVDALLFLVLLVLAIGSRRFWPIWAAGFHLCGLAVHFAAARLPDILPAAYAETLVIWSYPVLAAVLLGTLVEARGDRVE
jgi:hypothetical protein